MPGLNTTLTAAVTSASGGPFPPGYLVGANGFIAATSNPTGDSAGALSVSSYYGAAIAAIANDSASAPTQLTVCLVGSYDSTFLGDVTTPDGKVYLSAAANWVQNVVGNNTITQWIWPLASGGVALANGTVNIGNTYDTFITLVGDAPSSSQIVLNWTNSLASPAPTSFKLYRAVTSSTLSLYQTLGITNLDYDDTGLTASTEYTYQVEATYADGTASYSAVVQLFTPASGISDTFNCDCEAIPILPSARTLGSLRQSLLTRGGYAAQATNPPPGMVALANEFLQDAQRQLYRQHDEFHTKRMYAWQMQIGQRYYGITQDESGCRSLDPLNIEWVGFEDLNQAWYPLINGISPVLYTRAQISTGWPTHYEIRSCIEIFPAPKAQYTLWIKGHFGLDPFVADTDYTTLDSEAVFLLALGLFKMHYSQPDAGAVMTQADNMTKYLVAKQHGTRRYVPRTHVERPLTPPRFLPLGDGPP